MNIVYDGTYHGFLNALEKAFKEGHGSISYEEKENLFEENFILKTSLTDAKRFEKEIFNISQEAFKKIRLLWFSETAGFENLALGYIKNIFKYGEKGNCNLPDPCVSGCDRIARKVLSEVHRFKGFVRFSRAESGLMFSKISPEHNILPLLKNHFLTRFSKMPFAIYDEKRKICLFSINGRCEIKNIDDFSAEFSIDEKNIRQLWLKFFQTVEIKERKNKKLQKNKVPLKYRKNLVEFGE
ncbi:MAG: TIGR03915 family putative DNA repair protein [Elusimicrobiota bacterium]